MRREGAVYAAVHETLGKRVALKVILRELAADTAIRQRFFDEARAAAAVDSPHLVEVLALATLDDGRACLVMEFCDGESVAELIRARRRLPPAEAVSIAAEALWGLHAAHQRSR